MNNIETLTYIAERNNMTLTDFVFGYLEANLKLRNSKEEKPYTETI
jgi:hypothetical protein